MLYDFIEQGNIYNNKNLEKELNYTGRKYRPITEDAKITGLNKNYGTTHGNSKLTDAEVLRILKSTGSCKSIGEEFGVSAATVSLIKSGKRYNSVFEEYITND